MLIIDLPTEIIQQILDNLADNDLLNVVSCCKGLNVFPVKRWQHRERMAFPKKPLDFWIRTGNLKAVKFLYPAGRDYGPYCSSLEFGLKWGCYFGKLDIIKFLIEERSCPLYYDQFHMALINHSDYELIDYLYKKSAPLKNYDLYGLADASVEHITDITFIRYVHEKAKVQIPASCIECAIRYRNLPAVKYLHETVKIPITESLLITTLNIMERNKSYYENMPYNNDLLDYLKDTLKIQKFSRLKDI